MSIESSFKRHIFPHQQSQVIILDIDFQIDVIKNVIKALRDIISLTVSISGPSRIPKFGMAVLSTSEMIFPLKNLKENYEELLMFLNGCDNHIFSNNTNYSKDGVILKYLYTFSKQFNENDLSQNFVDNNYNQSKLELTIITDNTNTVLKECREFCRNSNIRNIQRIHLIVVKNYQKVEINQLSNSPQVDNDNFIEISVEEGIIEMKNLRSNHYVIFEDIFKNWLLDNSLESYHLDLLLRNPQNKLISIKCDLQECIINPSTLPQASSIMLEIDYSVSRTISYAGNNKLKAVPIYQMEAICQVDIDNVCDSLTYGQPLLVRPTMCWRLDFNQLSETQLYFQELCNQLTLSNRGLILKQQCEKIASYYFAIPANNYLILKCLASKELLMPRKDISSITNVPADVRMKIGDALATLKFENEYNPIFYESGIYQSNCLTNRKNKRSMNSALKSNGEKISFGFYDNF